MERENILNEQELESVTGGAAGVDFSRLTEDFARVNRCAGCPHKMIYRQHEMCMEVYGDLLQRFTNGAPVDMRCTRRQEDRTTSAL